MTDTKKVLALIDKEEQSLSISIPERFDYDAIPQLRAEAKQKLAHILPRNLAQASRISGITPSDIAILILSMHSEPTYVRTCLEAGARGYLLKNAMDLELVDAVKQVAKGERVLDPRLALLSDDQKADGSLLTTRELEVLQIIVHGKSNKDIAVLLGLSANTIAVHRANIMQALRIHNTAELVVYAIRNGLVDMP